MTLHESIAMRSIGIIGAIVILVCVQSEAFHSNSFDVIQGCKQYANLVAYDGPLDYFPTKNLQHVGHTDSSKFFRLAILGPNDGHIRFSSSPYPYDKDVIEIVLSGWGNTKSVGRRQHRTKANQNRNVQLAEAATPNLLSQFRPTMFVLEVFFNGTVQVRKDGENQAFLQFGDGDRTLPTDYMAFTKWDKELIYFYDCPLEETPANTDAVLLNCSIPQPKENEA